RATGRPVTGRRPGAAKAGRARSQGSESDTVRCARSAAGPARSFGEAGRTAGERDARRAAHKEQLRRTGLLARLQILPRIRLHLSALFGTAAALRQPAGTRQGSLARG